MVFETKQTAERAILVGISVKSQARVHEEDSLEELALLVDTAGAEVIDTVIQRRDKIHSGTYIGSGKAEELAARVQALQADTVIFDNDLSPAQNRNLENILNCKVIDRSAVILDIFALHARTTEAKLQVELAQLEYTLPRLTKMWQHLVGSQGGIGFRGPGETQLEVDRRIVKTKISEIRQKLDKIQAHRETQRKGREDCFKVAIVGYTNAGKSTLLNALAEADVYVENQLFATLDTTTRVVELGENQKTLLTDTVGFIRHLPHHLVASFRATLEETQMADALIHLVDASHHNYPEHIEAVNDVLADLKVIEKPTLLVFNKADLLNSTELNLVNEFPGSLVISAQKGNGLIALKEKLLQLMDNRLCVEEFVIPQSMGRIVDQIHQFGHIIKTDYEANNIVIVANIERALAAQIQRQLNNKSY